MNKVMNNIYTEAGFTVYFASAANGQQTVKKGRLDQLDSALDFLTLIYLATVLSSAMNKDGDSEAPDKPEVHARRITVFIRPSPRYCISSPTLLHPQTPQYSNYLLFGIVEMDYPAWNRENLLNQPGSSLSHEKFAHAGLRRYLPTPNKTSSLAANISGLSHCQLQPCDQNQPLTRTIKSRRNCLHRQVSRNNAVYVPRTESANELTIMRAWLDEWNRDEWKEDYPNDTGFHLQEPIYIDADSHAAEVEYLGLEYQGKEYDCPPGAMQQMMKAKPLSRPEHNRGINRYFADCETQQIQKRGPNTEIDNHYLDYPQENPIEADLEGFIYEENRKPLQPGLHDPRLTQSSYTYEESGNDDEDNMMSLCEEFMTLSLDSFSEAL
ncbi:hypothetical protein K504DRAFT_502640 [Pleomassaria siparia CBS 279.74]|uniref:Uncharacterized protein n=1 Tax=Pleomassaria siparia CBS 279.74 TaxID=1314801 RepID=A0A6G1K8C6_9PLEO|nr:hypothetical protein K504DRAFT_502640 [Pleomassaria siparia CBS 279.74]